MKKIIATVFCVLVLAGVAFARKGTITQPTFTSVSGITRNGGGAAHGDLLVTFSEAGLTPGATIDYTISAIGTCNGVSTAIGRGFPLTAGSGGTISQKVDVQQPDNCVGTTPVYTQGVITDNTNGASANF